MFGTCPLARNGSRTMKMMRIGATVICLVVASSVLGACSTSTTVSKSSHPISTPQGWRTYTYGKARISVPSEWAVERNAVCPINSAPGTLSLGNPKRYSGCPDAHSDDNRVILSSVEHFSSAHFSSQCPAIRVNGLRAYVGPCESSDADGHVSYWIPSLGLTAIGVGADMTVVSRVLHTLRR